MSTHNICFHVEIRKLFCGQPLLPGAIDTHVDHAFCSSFTEYLHIVEAPGEISRD